MAEGQQSAGNNGALNLFGDFGFVGGQDVAPNPLQNTQICINFYPEVDQHNPKEVVALLGCPGLVQLCSVGSGAPGFNNTMTTWPVPSKVTNLPVRGLWELPADNQALAVIGSVCYLVTLNQTNNAFPTLTLTSVGNLQTSSGPVCIRDNNVGGYAVIVDGPYGYYYQISGTTTATTSMQVTAGSNILYFAGVPLAGLYPGFTISDVDLYIPANTTITAVNYLANYITISNNATGTAPSDLCTINMGAFSQITDPNFLGADRVAYIDGWWIFNQPGTQKFYTNSSPYSLTFNSLYYALKDAYSDKLVTLYEMKEMLWLIGDKTTEIWYDAGGTYFPFSRLVGTLLQVGCKAKHSIARIGSNGQDSLIWLGRDDRGENKIMMTRGFSAMTISNPGFSAEVSQYPVTSDAVAYTYQEDTHEFYVLHFPTADVTWCYDTQTGLLHKRLSYDPYAQQFHRHRSNCFMNFAGMRIVGDYQNGALYQLTRNAYTDAGWPLLAQRRCSHIWDKGQRGRVFMASLQCDFRVGLGNESGMGATPQASISISRDGGKTFGQRWYAPLGAVGNYRNRTMWRRLGFGRDNVIDLQVIDPVNRDLVGVTLKAFSAA